MPRRRQARPFNVIVQGRRIAVSEAFRRYAELKLGKLARHFDQIQEAQVVLSVEKNRQVGQARVVEVTLRGDGVVLRGEQVSEDMYASIDGVVEKLEKQIEKYRSRLIEKRRIDAARTKRQQMVNAQAALRSSPPSWPPEIVRTKRFAMKPMTAEEAVMQMEMLGHDFFAFRDVYSGEVNVVYRRRDGDYGLIAPD